jgi:hypothetical protein
MEFSEMCFTRSYSLNTTVHWNTPILQNNYFSYLGIPIKPGCFLDPNSLVQNNVNKALSTMNTLVTISVDKFGFSELVSSRLYAQIVRPQL